MVRWRHHIQVLLYDKIGFRLYRSPTDELEYDAIVIYDYDGDNFALENWITQKFLPRMEPKFKIFLTSHDMRFGVEFDLLAASIVRCRRTLVILPDDMTCRTTRMMNFAFQKAFLLVNKNPGHHRIRCLLWEDFRVNDVVVQQFDIKLDHISKRDNTSRRRADVSGVNSCFLCPISHMLLKGRMFMTATTNGRMTLTTVMPLYHQGYDKLLPADDALY